MLPWSVTLFAPPLPLPLLPAPEEPPQPVRASNAAKPTIAIHDLAPVFIFSSLPMNNYSLIVRLNLKNNEFYIK
jgi:hypothetical protein